MKIELQNVFFSYNNKVKLDNFSYVFSSENIHCIMGASGCGKTTLLKLIMGGLKMQQGSLTFSQPPTFSAVFQKNILIEEMSAYKNISLCCKMSREQIAVKAKPIGLGEEQLMAQVSKLSGGEKRRVSILRAMLCENRILIMDEPFTGLDDKTKADTFNFVKANLNDRLCVFSTHNYEECEAMNAILLKM